MKALLSLILLVLIGFGVYWYLNEGRHDKRVQQTEQGLVSSADRMKEAVRDKLNDLSFDSKDIKEELAQSGRVIRKKAREVGAAVSDATADARVTGAIKAKLVADPDLSALSISVNTTDGVVTLSGSVSSHEEIGKAMKLALETDGAREVVSTLQIRHEKPAVKPTP
jgi:hyperosmotically inducible periplasmic protein